MPIIFSDENGTPDSRRRGRRRWLWLALPALLVGTICVSFATPLEVRLGPLCVFAAPIRWFYPDLRPDNIQGTFVPLPEGAGVKPTLVWHDPVGWVHKPHGLPVTFGYFRYGDFAYRLGFSWSR